ncbi:hypothetical protein D9M70_556000 [compost metagenome]
MILGFLAVEAPRQVAAMMLRQRHCCRGSQRNALVGRPEQNVEGDAAVHYRGGVETPQLGQRQAAVEQTCVEEVRAGAPGLESELAKAQNAAFDGETNEFALICLHRVGTGRYEFS